MLYSLRQFKPYPISVYWLVEGDPYSGYSGLAKSSINLAKKWPHHYQSTMLEAAHTTLADMAL
jgi:hypothetical protein